jgi:uncharacterized protein YbbK (DUF523 family)
MLIVSACLAGVHCRYDGGTKPDERVMRLVAQGKAVPVCPEQLGGLPTPRLPAEQVGERVVNRQGVDVTAQFRRGAEEALQIARLAGVSEAILKARSPSCGSGSVYDGTFSNRLVEGDGVFARLCKENGITVRSEDEIERNFLLPETLE